MTKIVSCLPWTSFLQAKGSNCSHWLLLLHQHYFTLQNRSCYQQDSEKLCQNPVLPDQHYYKQSVVCPIIIFLTTNYFILKCHFKSHRRIFFLSHLNYCNAFLLQCSKCSGDARKSCVMVLIAQNSISIPEAEENNYNVHHSWREPMQGTKQFMRQGNKL